MAVSIIVAKCNDSKSVVIFSYPVQDKILDNIIEQHFKHFSWDLSHRNDKELNNFIFIKSDLL